MSLLNSRDVQHYGLLGANTNLGAIGLNLKVMESHVARRILGYPFYTTLLGDVVAADRDAIAWDQGKTYATGNVVNFEGVTYRSTADNNTNVPTGTGWQLSTRFTTAAYETFWTGYLRPYLTKVVSLKVFLQMPAIGDNGLMMTEATDEKNQRSATRAERADRINVMKQAAAEDLEALFFYVMNEKENGSTLFDTSYIIIQPDAVRRFFMAPRRRFFFQNKNTADRYEQARTDTDRIN